MLQSTIAQYAYNRLYTVERSVEVLRTDDFNSSFE